jgi:hypothetical protein
MAMTLAEPNVIRISTAATTSSGVPRRILYGHSAQLAKLCTVVELICCAHCLSQATACAWSGRIARSAPLLSGCAGTVELFDTR